MRVLRHLLPAILCLLVGLLPPHPATAKAASWTVLLRTDHPMSVAVDTRGSASGTKWAYTANYYRGTITRFGTGGKVLKTWRYAPAPLYKLGADIAVGGSGNVFVADAVNGVVDKFDPHGRRLAQFTGFNLPRGVAIDRAGNIYVAETGAKRITRLSPGGTTLAQWPAPWTNGVAGATPFDIAVNGQGSIFVAVTCQLQACRDDHTDLPEGIVRLNSAGVLQSAMQGSTPHGGMSKEDEPWVGLSSISVDARGTLYAAGMIRSVQGNFAPGVLVYGSGSYLGGKYVLPGIPAPTGVGADRAGNLYVSQENAILVRRSR